MQTPMDPTGGRGERSAEPTLNASVPPPTTIDAGGQPDRRWARDVLPLATSLALHASLIVLGVALYHAVRTAPVPQREQVVIPDMSPMRPGAEPVGPVQVGPPVDLRMLDPSQSPPATDGGFSPAPSGPVAFGGGSDGASSFIGSRDRAGRGISGPGNGGPPWGVPRGDGLGTPGQTFFNVPTTGGNADEVVYLCDASGSMVGVFGQLKTELKRSIGELRVDGDVNQRFNVIFFADGDARTLFPAGPQLATVDAKRRAADFIDNQVSVGGTDPMPAIKLALAERPQVLYVLTDGFDQIADMDAVVDAFRRGDADGHTHVNCIFLQSDEDPKLVAALQRIAEIGHGTFKAILKRDM
jgi:hypothetical protein